MTDWSTRLLPGDTPVFRHTHRALAELAPRRDRLAAREVAHEILSDPFATLLLIHAINKKMAQRSGNEVTTVEHAVMMQGIGAYLDTARALPVIENTPAGQDTFALRALHGLVRRAQHAAWQARDFAVLHSDIQAEEVQVAAILHHVPEMLLWLRAPAEARRLRALYRQMPAEEAAATVLGQPLQAWRLAILEAWNVPEFTRDLLDPARTGQPRQTILAACIDIARRAEKGWWDEALLQDYQALADLDHLPLEQVIAIAHANAARAARGSTWLAATPAGAWIPMIPGPWPAEEDEAPQPSAAPRPASETAAPRDAAVAPVQARPAAVEPARLAAPAPDIPQAPPPRTDAPQAAPRAAAGEAPAPDEHLACPMPDKQVFRDALKGIESHLDGSYNLNQMSAVILKGLHTGLGLTRILFAMVTPDGERVKSRFTLGIAADDPLRHFEFRLDGKDLFAQLMGKMQGVWINEGNRERLWPMVDPRLQKLVGASDFYAMSLFNGSRPLGLIYADRGHGECGLDPLTYTDFKMLCLQAARGLGKVRG